MFRRALSENIADESPVSGKVAASGMRTDSDDRRYTVMVTWDSTRTHAPRHTPHRGIYGEIINRLEKVDRCFVEDDWRVGTRGQKLINKVPPSPNW